MIEAAELGVVVGWTDKGATKGLQELDRRIEQMVGSAARGGQAIDDGMTRPLQRLEERSSRLMPTLGGVTKALGALGIAVGAAAAVRKLTQEFGAAVQAGSALNESINKVNVVFGQQARAIQEWSKRSADAFGLTRQQALEAVGTFGNLFTSMDLGRAKAAEMSQGLVQLAADLASFNNREVADVIQALQSGLVGEVEPLRRLGVAINAAQVEAKALAMGLAETKSAITEADKAQARYALILEQTRNAQGDFARTSDEWANANRRLQAALGDVRAEIGMKLLPALTPLLDTIAEFVNTQGPALVRELSNAIDTLSAMSEVVKSIEYQRVTDEMDRLGRRTTNLGEQLAGFFTNAALYLDLIKDYWIDTFSLMGDTLGTFGDLITGKINLDEFKSRFLEFGDTLIEASERFADTFGEITANVGHYDEMVAGIERVNEANDQATDYWERHRAAVEEFAAAAPVATEAAWSMADVWAQAWQAMEQTTQGGVDANQARIQEWFAAQAQEYASHAVRVWELERQRTSALAGLEAEYQQLTQQLQAQRETSKLQMLAQAYDAKRSMIVAGYNAQIATEKSAQTTLMTNAKQHYLTVLRMMQQQLMAKVRTTVAAMAAMVGATVGGYTAMTAAVVAYNQAKAGLADIAALQRAMAEVQAAMAGIETTANDAIASAAAQLDAATGSAGSLEDAIGGVGGAIGDIGRAGGGGGVRERLVDPIEEAARMAERLASMAQRAMEAFDALAMWGGPAAGWEEAFDALTEAITSQVRRFAEAADALRTSGLLEQERREELLALADLVSKIAAAYRTAADVIERMGAMEAIADIDALADALVDQVRVLMNRMRTLAQEFSSGLTGEQRLQIERGLELLTNALKPWGEGVKAIETVVSASGRDISDKVDRLAQQITALVTALADALGDIDRADLQRAARAAEQVTKALEPWRKAAEAVNAVAGVTQARIGPNAERLRGQIWSLVRKIAWIARDIGDEMPDILVRSAEAAALIVRALEPWRKATEAVNAITGVTQARIGPNAERLRGQIWSLVRKIAWIARDIGDEMPDILVRSAEAAGLIVKALEPWEKAIKTVNAIAGHRDVVIGPLSERLASQMLGLARKLARLGNEIPAEDLERAAKVAQLFEEVLAPWEHMIKIATEMRAFRLVSDLQDKMARFARMWLWILDDFRQAVRELDQEGLDAVEAFSQALDSLMNGLQAAMELAGEFEFDEPDAGTWEAFEDWVWAVFDEFYRRLNGLLPPADNADLSARYEEGGIGLVGAFGRALNDLMDGLQGALAVARDFDFSAPDPMVWGAFEDWVWAVYDSFYRKLNELGLGENETGVGYTEEGSALVGAFASALSDLMQGLQSALNIARDFTFTAPPADAWQAFEDWVEEVFRAFYDYISREVDGVPYFGGDGIDAVEAFGEALEALMQGLQSALDIARDFTFEQPTPHTWQAFFDWVTAVFAAFEAEVRTRYPQSAEDAQQFEPVQAFGEAMEAVFGGLTAALEVFDGLLTFLPPTEARMDAFLHAVEYVFNRMATYAQSDLVQAGNDAVNKFSEALGNVMDGLRRSLDVFETLATAEDATIDFIAGASSGSDTSRFMQRVGYLFAAIHETLVRFRDRVVDSAGTSWVPAAQQFFDALEQVFGILRDALQLFVDLERMNLPTPDRITAFVNAILQLFTELTAGLLDARSDIDAAVTGIANKLESGQRALTSGGLSDQYQGAGRNLSRAFAVGIWENEWMVEDAATDIAEAALRAIQEALDIQSPSRVMMRIGGLTGEGLARGLHLSREDVQREMDNLLGVIDPGLAQDAMRLEANRTEKREIVVRFEGEAGGGPLTPAQFDALKRQLVYDIRRMA